MNGCAGAATARKVQQVGTEATESESGIEVQVGHRRLRGHLRARHAAHAEICNSGWLTPLRTVKQMKTMMLLGMSLLVAVVTSWATAQTPDRYKERNH